MMIDLKKLWDAMPRDVQRKISCDDLKRTVDNYNKITPVERPKSEVNSVDLVEWLAGEPKPSGKQVAWFLCHLAESFDKGKSFSRVMQDAYGFGSKESVWCSNVGQYVNNAILCCRETPAAMAKFNGCHS